MSSIAAVRLLFGSRAGGRVPNGGARGNARRRDTPTRRRRGPQSVATAIVVAASASAITSSAEPTVIAIPIEGADHVSFVATYPAGLATGPSHDAARAAFQGGADAADVRDIGGVGDAELGLEIAQFRQAGAPSLLSHALWAESYRAAEIAARKRTPTGAEASWPVIGARALRGLVYDGLSAYSGGKPGGASLGLPDPGPAWTVPKDEAVYVVAGAFDRATLDARVTEFFPGATVGALDDATPVPREAAPTLPEQINQRTWTAEHTELAASVVWLGWPAPPADDEAWLELQAALWLLADGPQSRLAKRLQVADPFAVEIVPHLSTERGASLASIRLRVSPGVDPERVRRAAIEEIERFSDEPLASEELARAQRELRRAYEASWSTPTGLAAFIGRRLALGLPPSLEVLREGIDTLDPASVAEAATSHLGPLTRSVVQLDPARPAVPIEATAPVPQPGPPPPTSKPTQATPSASTPKPSSAPKPESGRASTVGKKP